MTPDDHDPELVALAGGGSTEVRRSGDVVLRRARPWSPTVLALLRHLRQQGVTTAPKVVEPGLSPDGWETLGYIAGESPQPHAWSDEAIFALGEQLRALHDATGTFTADSPQWMQWWGRDLPGGPVILGHCDLAPWNVLARDGQPVAIIDWDTAGPVALRWELAQAAWLNAQLHDDDIAERQGLADLAGRCRQLRLFCDGYRLDRATRAGLVDAMIEFAVRSAAQEVIEGGVSPDGVSPAPVSRIGGGAPTAGHDLLWAVTWRTRSAAWMLRHRAALERVLA